MPRSRVRIILAAVVVCSGALGAWWWWWSKPPRTNLLIVTLDTTRADRIGAWSGPPGLTPVLDQLASRGFIFDRAYAPAPLTLPSHVSLMTGLNPPEHGIRLNSGTDRLGAEVPVLAEILKQHGYSTAAFVGSFVLDAKFGLDRGFEIYDDKIHQHGNPTGMDSHNHPMRLGEEVVDSALSWLYQHRQKPFFCWVHLFDPHTPYDAREGLFGDRYRDRPYDAGIAYVDFQVGKLMRFLERQGLEQRTIVVVLGDHGESLGEHQERTHGLTLYEATVHVPLIFRFPDSSPAASRSSTPVSLIDVFPTLLSELGVPFVKTGTGRTLAPAIRGEELPPFPIYIETDHPYGEGGWSPQRGLISEDWKYIRSPRPELYHLARDPRELTNRAETNQEEMADLEQLLQEREAGFVRRTAVNLLASEADQRKLASLGYLGGNSSTDETQASLADIKDMISLYNSYSDATVLFVQGRYEEAREILEAVVQTAPNYHQAWLYLGTCHIELGNYTQAKEALERSVAIAGDPTARIVLGRFYLTHKEPASALPHLEIAVRMRPKSVTGHFFLGETFRMQEQPEKAREEYNLVLQLSPDFLPAREALDSLPH